MRIILTGLGTTGDIYPLIALATELQQNHHHVTLALSPAFATLVASFNLDFAPVGPDIQEALQSVVATRVGMAEFFKSAEDIDRFFAPVAAALPQIFEEMRVVCRGAEMLVAGATQPTARMVHEELGIPYVAVHFSPPGAGNLPAMQQARLSMINRVRQQFNLPRLNDPATAFVSSQLTLYAMSRHMVPPSPSWPGHYHLTGFFYLDSPDWQPDPELVQFLDAGEQPVVISFGSMRHSDPVWLTEILVRACQQAGCRAIIQQGWSGLAQIQLPANVYPLGFAPHGWLFNQAACVVHHGGAGTTGAATRAGVPQVIVPHLGDQPMWARLTQELGCTSSPIPFGELTAEWLSQTLLEIKTNARYRRAAIELAEKVRFEQGVSKARQLIETLGQQCGGQPISPALESVEEADAKIQQRTRYQQRQRAKHLLSEKNFTEEENFTETK